MGQRSKATLARLNSFSKLTNPQNSTVEEVLARNDEDTHSEEEDHDFLELFFLDEGQPDDDSDSDEEDLEVDVEENVKNSLDDVPILQI
jgi:hypothetical protein